MRKQEVGWTLASKFEEQNAPVKEKGTHFRWSETRMNC